MPFKSLMNWLWDEALQPILPLNRMQWETLMAHYVTLWLFFVVGVFHYFSSTMRKERGREAGTHYRSHFLHTELRERGSKTHRGQRWNKKKRVMFWKPLLPVVCSCCNTDCDIFRGFLCPSPVLPMVLCVPSLLIMAIFKHYMVSLIEMEERAKLFTHRKDGVG